MPEKHPKKPADSASEESNVKNDLANAHGGRPKPIVSKVPEITITEDGDGEDAGDLFDPCCDPKNPVAVTFRDISAAAYKIKDGIQRTPCTVCRVISVHKFEF